jgi:hypothetical protein
MNRMSLLEIQQHLQVLPAEQLLEVRAFLDRLEAERFDERLKQDSESGKFDHLIHKLEQQIESGQWKPI